MPGHIFIHTDTRQGAGHIRSLLPVVLTYTDLLEQSGDLTGLIHIDPLSSRNLRKTWHGHNLAGQSYDKACTCGDLQVTYRYFESSRSTQFVLVIR